LLLRKGAEIDARDEGGETALFYAFHEHLLTLERYNAAMALLARGTDVNAANNDGETALMQAANGFQPDIVQLMLDKGATVNARDKRGRTCLMTILDAKVFSEFKDVFKTNDYTVGFVSIVREMIERGVDINAMDADGNTALLLAVRGGHTLIVPLLLAKGADVNARSKNGDTALKSAREKRLSDVVAQLQKAGAKE
jgi:ankyrin repeat protein